MNSDTVITALRHLRRGALPWEGIASNTRADCFGRPDQSQEQALGFDFDTICLSAPYLGRFLTPNQVTPDSGFAPSGEGGDQKPIIFLSYGNQILAIDRDIIGMQPLLKIAHEAAFRVAEIILDLSDDWAKIQSATAPPGSRPILPLESSEVWEDDARFDLLVEKELSRQLVSSEREEIEMLNQKRNRTLARVSNEEMERENLKEAALIELENLINKYASIFDKRT